MPYYQIYHSHPLTSLQRSLLASKLTSLHSTTFSAPSLFVNISFHLVTPQSSVPLPLLGSLDIGSYEGEDYFVGGKRREGKRKGKGWNVILGFVRGGGGRNEEGFGEFARMVEGAWDSVVCGEDSSRNEEGVGEGENKEGKDEEEEKGKKLQAVFIVPGIVAREGGMGIPSAGEEATWLLQNLPEFERRAKSGDEDFIALLDEIAKRPELRVPKGI